MCLPSAAAVTAGGRVAAASRCAAPGAIPLQTPGPPASPDDDAGCPTSLTGETRTGTNAFTASYTRDGEGNRTSQTIGANSYGCNANPRQRHPRAGYEQTGRTLNGAAHTLGYDYEGQLTQITQGQNTTDFVYDALGRRYSRTAGGTW
jgi:YD repeat-containing protein